MPSRNYVIRLTAAHRPLYRKPKYLLIPFLMILKIQHEKMSHKFASAKLNIDT